MMIVIAYPREGPRKGIKINIVVGAALCSGLLTSASVPAPIASAGANIRPAKNLKIQSDAMFCEKPAPIVKMAPRGADTR